mmetsp:Transcript_49827/g.108333  ORF Transcript_49827/g.108333 Transcript_49827/m.108333 type:complete len:410 (+) Transcript_49827:106-1335(+)
MLFDALIGYTRRGGSSLGGGTTCSENIGCQTVPEVCCEADLGLDNEVVLVEDIVEASRLPLTGEAAPAAPAAEEGPNFFGVFPAGPQTAEVTTYSAKIGLELQGEPLCTGKLLYIRPGDTISEVTLSLHTNGFGFIDDRSDPSTTRWGWSPFSLVEKLNAVMGNPSDFWAEFKMSVFRQTGEDMTFYFVVTGVDAQKRRDIWMDAMTNAIRQLTLSLFPPFAIAVHPVPGVRSTSTRILAGYLLRCEPNDMVSLLYCELHSYIYGEARLVQYRNEWCDQIVRCVLLTTQTVISTRAGAACTVFAVDDTCFCVRTPDEKELWLRAVSNIKVKLRFAGPSPTFAELDVMRACVLQRAMEIPDLKGGVVPMLPVLPRNPVPLCPVGDLEPAGVLEECLREVSVASSGSQQPA